MCVCPSRMSGRSRSRSDLPDEKVLFLSDIYPTGYQGALNANIMPGDTVAVWGCGPVGLFAIASAYMLGAGKVIAIDRFPERLKLAREYCGATTIDYTARDVHRRGGAARPDRRHGSGQLHRRGRHGSALEHCRGHVRCGKAGADARDGPAVRVCGRRFSRCARAARCRFRVFTAECWTRSTSARRLARACTWRWGRRTCTSIMAPLLKSIEEGKIDPSFMISHRIGIEQAPEMYKVWRDKTGCGDQDRDRPVAGRDHGLAPHPSHLASHREVRPPVRGSGLFARWPPARHVCQGSRLRGVWS